MWRGVLRGGLARYGLTAVLAAALLLSGSGCATLAHRNSAGHRARSTEMCKGDESVCPWLAGDAAWLLAGVIPGVVAFIVDFGSGAWKHHEEEPFVRTASDDMAAQNSE